MSTLADGVSDAKEALRNCDRALSRLEWTLRDMGHVGRAGDIAAARVRLRTSGIMSALLEVKS